MNDFVLKGILLPTLFKRTSTGAIQEWEIWTDGKTVRTRWGHIEGAKQETSDTIEVAKSQDTAEKQAEFEAEAKWTKQKKRGYVESADDARGGKLDPLIEGGIAPMLAEKFADHKKKIRYPAYVQPKFDGHRCTAEIDEESATLWSRTRKPVISVPHIAKALFDTGFPWVPDGELYEHSYHANFDDLTSILNQKTTPAENHEVAQYHIYDIAEPNRTFEERNAMLTVFFEKLGDHPCLKPVLTLIVNSEEELWAAYDRFMEEGYEGAIVRNRDGRYAYRRSFDLQKVVKKFTREWPIIDIVEGRGKDKGHAIFVVRLDSGILCDAKMKGPHAKLKIYWENRLEYIGQSLTIEYRCFTKKGSLRFPVALRLRKDL